MKAPAQQSIFLFLSSHPKLLVRHFSTSLSHSSSSSSRRNRNEEESKSVKVTVWWDVENCAIPHGVSPYRVAHRISSALRLNGIKGPLTITAFGNMLQLSHATQDALCTTGVSLSHVPNCGKNSTDRSILADLLYWVAQNPPPAHFLLISGDKDFASILHRLRMSNYNILVVSSSLGSTSLSSAATIMWNWNVLVKGDDIMGKHFNHPPDGLYGSWYGHCKGALEEPLVDADEAGSMLSDPEDSSKHGTDSSNHSILKILARKISRILSFHPEGISVTDLHKELRKSGLVFSKDYYGYKKFSSLVSSLTNIAVLKPHPSCDSNLIVYSASGKSVLDHPSLRPDLNEALDLVKKDVSGTEDVNSMLSFRASRHSTEESNHMQDKYASPPTSLNHFAAEDGKPSDLSFHTSVSGGLDVSDTIRYSDSDVIMSKESAATNFCNPDGMRSEATESHRSSSTARSLDDTDRKVGDLKSVEEYGSSFEKGFFQNIWRTWLGSLFWPSSKTISGTSMGNSLESEHTEKSPLSVDSSSKESTQIGSKVEPVDCQMDSSSTKKIPSNQSEDKQGLYNKDVADPTLNTKSHYLFSKKLFWSSLEAFLCTANGSEVVSKSMTRDQLILSLQSEGPMILSSLADSDISHLIDLLVSKKWVDENSSRLFPFKVRLPARRSCTPSHHCGSDGLSSIFSFRGSQSPSGSAKRMEDHDQNPQSGNIDQMPPKNLLELKAWYRNTCDGNENVKVKDLSARFEKQFGRKIDAKSYGYSKVENLLAACTTVNSCNQENKTKIRQVTRNEMLSDCRKLVKDCLVESPAGILLRSLEPMFSEKYGYCLDHKKLGYKELSDMINIFPGARVKHGLIVPKRDYVPDQAESIPGMVETINSGAQTQRGDSVDVEDGPWEELGALSETQMLESGGQREGQIQLDEIILSDEESTDSDNSTSLEVDKNKVPENQRKDNEKSSLVELLETWHGSKVDNKNKYLAVDELMNCSDSTSSLRAGPVASNTSSFRSKTSKKYNFVTDSGDDKLTRDMLQWLKKSRSRVNT